MASEPAENKTSAAYAASSGAPGGSRLAVLTAFAIAAASLPLPVVPDRVIIRIRGAVVQDTVTRHGLSLTTDARQVLAKPGTDQTTLRRAAEVVTQELLRRLNPFGAVAATARGLDVYVLGYLLDRYIVRYRRAGAVRVHAEEARQVRDAIDRAMRRAFSPTLQAGITVFPGGTDDLRDEFTRWVDALLLAGAAVPEFVNRRLEVAFDEIALTAFTHD